MDLPFDTTHESTKLAEVREREEEDLAHILSGKYGMSYVDLSQHDIDGDALRIIPEVEARAAETVAFEKVAKVLSIAVHNPNNPAYVKLAENLEKRGYMTKKFLISQRSLDRALVRYADLSLAQKSRAGVFTFEPEMVEKIRSEGAS